MIPARPAAVLAAAALAALACGGDGPSARAAAADRAAPALSSVRMVPPRFRAGTAVQAASAGRPAVGGRLRLTVSEAARVTVRIDARFPGKRVRGRCVPPLAATRGKACFRWVTRGAVSARVARGAAAVDVTGSLRGRLLAAGPHRVVVTARDRAGNRSRAATAAFTVLPPPAAGDR